MIWWFLNVLTWSVKVLTVNTNFYFTTDTAGHEDVIIKSFVSWRVSQTFLRSSYHRYSVTVFRSINQKLVIRHYGKFTFYMLPTWWRVTSQPVCPVTCKLKPQPFRKLNLEGEMTAFQKCSSGSYITQNTPIFRHFHKITNNLRKTTSQKHKKCTAQRKKMFQQKMFEKLTISEIACFLWDVTFFPVLNPWLDTDWGTWKLNIFKYYWWASLILTLFLML